MKIKVLNHLNEEIKYIRSTVFEIEQGFIDEFDEIDDIATFFVAYNNTKAIGTCRIFIKDDTYVLGRLAVLKEYRGQKVGTELMNKVDEFIKTQPIKRVILHAQEQAKDFYVKCGYKQFKELDYEQDCPHVWMEKIINE